MYVVTAEQRARMGILAMTTLTIEQLLAESAPGRISTRIDAAPAIDGLLESVKTAERADRPRRRRKALLIALPIALLGAGALTAGGVAVASFDWSTKIDIPIHYTTDTGRSFECTVIVKSGAALDLDALSIGNALRARDWSGIGQKIYDRALSHPHVLQEGESSDNLDEISWYDALFELVPGPQPLGWGFGASSLSVGSDCTGELH